MGEEIKVIGELKPGYELILSKEALLFLAKLQRRFNKRRLDILIERKRRQEAITRGVRPDFLVETEAVRKDPSWKVREPPQDLQKRYVEITGPVDKKMMINALNSGADGFMADFEDALSPTWTNVIEGQINLIEAIDKKLTFTSFEGKHYALNTQQAVLMVRPRGFHLEEKHMLVDGALMSASLFDFGLYFYHNQKRLLAKKTGPYFYLPKLESHLEARLWNDIFLYAQEECSAPKGSICATVLIETILAAFEMEEILYELKEHCVGLNAGRWDYIFSTIKKFQNSEGFIFPDRIQITMTVPFMRAYTELLIKTCHKRGAHAMGGMAAFIPSRKNVEVNTTALKKVQEDKERESKDGFDGTWVAHPDLVPIARDIFARFLQNRPSQKERLREDVNVTSQELLDFHIPGGTITEEALRKNISVSLQYLESWLRGQGAVALFNLMEDTATAEIARAQIWQWLHQKKAVMSDGSPIDIPFYRRLASEEHEKIRLSMSKEAYQERTFELAFQIIDELVTKEPFEDFLTLTAYKYLK